MWSCGDVDVEMEMWRCGCVVMWRWRCEDVEMWMCRCGDMKMWRFGVIDAAKLCLWLVEGCDTQDQNNSQLML